ncbi:MAG: histidine kinase dimerization/phosphoacceptor domain -containing protein [Crocinitomicaceae bacterium]|nr:histidine kinase dimerization/phosphoacceptor domain -containing protein [Crocinitomicaceae bacterium]
MLNNMGAIYNDLKEYDKAKVVLDSCIKLSQRVQDSMLLGMALNNLGGVYSKSKETVDTGLVLLEQSLEIFKELESDQWLAFTHSKLGSIYLDGKDYEKAHQNGLEAEKYAEKLGFKELIRRSSSVLKKTYSVLGDYENAYLYSEKHAAIDKELRGEENRIEALKLENQYKLENQKEIDDKELKLANADKDRQKIITNALIAGAIVLFIFTLFVIYRLRLSNKRKRKIEQQNNERSLLLKEIHHRVKNNFQIISSLLRLQAAEENDEHIEHVFDDAVSRIQSMASIHELIYKQEMFAELGTKEYLDKLITTIRSYSVHSKVKISAETEIDRLNIKTLVPIGITINELVTNSLKYAFEKSAVDPQIEVSLTKSPTNDFTLTYKDNGIGFEQPDDSSSFGMELIDTVISQIDGVIQRKTDVNWKNKVEIHFKEVL